MKKILLLILLSTYLYGQKSGFLYDIDGNEYEWIQIGTQYWMAENLKTTKYKNGVSIPNVTDRTTWTALTSGAYCWYNNSFSSNGLLYGALYNWYTVTDTNGLAPDGWQIPTKADFDTLSAFASSGSKLKDYNTLVWASITDITNELFFKAPGGGYANGSTNGYQFDNIRVYGYWWCSSVYFDNGYALRLQQGSTSIYFGSYTKKYGHSVRCVRYDEPPSTRKKLRIQEQ